MIVFVLIGPYNERLAAGKRIHDLIVASGHRGTTMLDLTTLTIAEASRRMARRELSPVELTQAALERIERLNPRLNAFITVLGDQAIDGAKVAEREVMAGKIRGPLHGIPIALKDLCAPRG